MIRKLMMGLAAAALISMVPMTVSAREHVSTTKSTHRATINSMPMGTFKYKSARRKPGTYGSSKSTPE